MTAKIYVDRLDEGWVLQDGEFVSAFRSDEVLRQEFGKLLLGRILRALEDGVEIGPAVDVRITITPRKSKLNTK